MNATPETTTTETTTAPSEKFPNVPRLFSTSDRAKLALGSSLALGLALSSHTAAHVYAAPVETINLSDVTDIDSLPVCVQEDCSDQPNQTGVWLDRDTGNWYLERGESTWLIVDDTVTGGH